MKLLPKPQTRIVQVMKRSLWLLGLTCLLILNPGTVRAYDVDTHYVFTYYLARKVGYTQQQARQIASGNAGIDYADDTGPFQFDLFLNPSDSAQIARAKFHALPGSRDALTYFLTSWTLPKSRDELAKALTRLADKTFRLDLVEERQYRQEINERLNQLWSQALATGNLGIYLHYLQDTFSHEGFLSFKGHLVPGHAKDFLSQDAGQAEKMTVKTIEALQRFMRDGLNRVPCQPNMAEVRQVLNQLKKANPTPRVIDISTKFPIVRSVLATYGKSPDWRKAYVIVTNALREDFPRFAERIVYDFDQGGNPKIFEEKITQGRRRPDGPSRLTVKRVPIGDDPKWKLVDTRPIDLIIGTWKSSDTKLILIDLDEQSGLKLNGDHDHRWKGSYEPQMQEWVFTRKPTAQEMSEKAPEWARLRVQNKLEWRLVLKYEGCKLVGKWYPGLIKWEEVRDKKTDKVLLDRSKAWVEGQGEPRTVEYRFYSTREIKRVG